MGVRRSRFTELPPGRWENPDGSPWWATVSQIRDGIYIWPTVEDRNPFPRFHILRWWR